MFKSKKSAILILTAVVLIFEATAIYAQIKNPIGSDSFAELIKRIAQEIRPIAITFSVVFIIYSGFLFVTASGNPEKLKSARTTFTWTIVGTAIVVGASLLAEVVINTIRNL